MLSTFTTADDPENVSESNLLKTPTEVQDNILRYVLGDRLIHIKYLTKEEGEGIHIEKEDEETKAVSGKLCSAFCVATQSEQEAYDEANLSSGNFQATKAYGRQIPSRSATLTLS